jgi:hypothetical protein
MKSMAERIAGKKVDSKKAFGFGLEVWENARNNGQVFRNATFTKDLPEKNERGYPKQIRVPMSKEVFEMVFSWMTELRSKYFV